MDKINFKYSGVYNIFLAGDSGVGKTQLIFTYLKRNTKKSLATIGFDFFSLDYMKYEKLFKIKLWDGSGTKRFFSYWKQYLRNVNGVIFVYSVDNRNSFDSIRVWVDMCRSVNKKAPTMLLLGNKCDSLNRKVTYEEGEELGKELGMEFFEVSSKTRKGVFKVFDYCIEKTINLIQPFDPNHLRTQKFNMLIYMKKNKKYKKNICQT